MLVEIRSDCCGTPIFPCESFVKFLERFFFLFFSGLLDLPSSLGCFTPCGEQSVFPSSSYGVGDGSRDVILVASGSLTRS